MSAAPPGGCSELGGAEAELALGLLSGTERARALAHLSVCPACRDRVDHLARVADQLLLLAPEVDPRAGFESRVLAGAGVGVRTDGRPRRGLRLLAVAGVAVVVALVGAGAAQLVGQGPQAPPLRTALAVSASGRSTCRVVVSGSRPASVLVALDGPVGVSADYDVELETAAGAPIRLGPLRVDDGHGALAATLDIDAARLRVVRVRGPDGRVLYEAALREERPRAVP